MPIFRQATFAKTEKHLGVNKTQSIAATREILKLVSWVQEDLPFTVDLLTSFVSSVEGLVICVHQQVQDIKSENEKLSSEIKPILKTINFGRSVFAKFASGTIALLAFASLSQVWGKTVRDAFVTIGVARIAHPSS